MTWMAVEPQVLLSLHERWAEAILARGKRWEFRRRCGLQPGMRVWIYVTAPRAEIIGYFTVGEVRPVDAKNPDPNIAAAGLSTLADLRSYFGGRFAATRSRRRHLADFGVLSGSQRENAVHSHIAFSGQTVEIGRCCADSAGQQ